MGSRVPQALSRVSEVLRAAGVNATRPGYTRYIKHDPEARLFELEVGIPVREAIPGAGDVLPSELPGGTAALVWHEGPYASLGQSFARLSQLVAAQALTPSGPLWESYAVGPANEPDSAKWRTALYQPVSKGTA
jgi:effector-binding domain-containing protein